MPKVPTKKERMETAAQTAAVAATAVTTVVAAWKTVTEALGDGADGDGVFAGRRAKRKQREKAVRYAQTAHGRILIDVVGPNDDLYDVVFDEHSKPVRSFPESDVPCGNWPVLEHVRPEDLSDPDSLRGRLRRGR
jgi:hypothetical protein